MKILHISECIKGGVGTYLNELYYHKDKKNKYHLFFPDNEKKYLSSLLIKNQNFTSFHRKKRNLFFLLSFFLFIKRNIKIINPDIIHLHSSFAGFIVRFYYFFTFKRPKIIYCPHGWSFLMDLKKIKKYIFLIIELFLSIKTDKIINVSNYEYIESIKLGIPQNKSIIIKNGINEVINKSDKKIIKHQQNKINFLFVGRDNIAKGYEKLFNYFKQKKEHALHIVGDFNIDNKIENNIIENIFFYDWVPNDEIHNHYIESDVIIIPSRWEAFGLVGIEAMKYSRPLIVSNRGALKELIEEGENGFSFDYDNFDISLDRKINKLMISNLKNMGRKSFSLFKENYTIEKTINKINDLYNNIL